MKRLTLKLLAVPALLACSTGAVFADDAAALAVDLEAPAFSLPGSDGETYTLEGLRGKTVVIAWFPKAFTGG